jgi:glycerophosphoryl diester phosphodiesterase
VVESAFCVERASGCVGICANGCRARFEDFRVRRLPDTPTVARQMPVRCENVAHRGHSTAAPENTLAALQAAVAAGAEACEFDVLGCSDGTVVLMHDATVDRTTDGTGRVSDLTLDQLKQLDAGSWKHARFAGETIPTLEEALRLLKPTGCRPVIELKTEGICRQVVETVRRQNMVERAVIIAFSQNAVRQVREWEPRLACGWLCGDVPVQGEAEKADWLAARAWDCHTKLLDLNYQLISPELVSELNRRGLTVWAWTVNEPPIMRALAEWGVRAITTDRPDQLAIVLQTPPDESGAE